MADYICEGVGIAGGTAHSVSPLVASVFRQVKKALEPPPPHKTSPRVFGALNSCTRRLDEDYTSSATTIDKSKGAVGAALPILNTRDPNRAC